MGEGVLHEEIAISYRPGCWIGFLDIHRNREITLNEEYNVDPQYASCYCYDDLVPNGETASGRARECLIRENITR
jgi:hypothetical protein